MSDDAATTDRLHLIYMADVDGFLVRLDGHAKGVVDEEDLADHCPLWKDRDTADEMELYAQIEPHLHAPRGQEGGTADDLIAEACLPRGGPAQLVKGIAEQGDKIMMMNERLQLTAILLPVETQEEADRAIEGVDRTDAIAVGDALRVSENERLAAARAAGVEPTVAVWAGREWDWQA